MQKHMRHTRQNPHAEETHASFVCHHRQHRSPSHHRGSIVRERKQPAKIHASDHMQCTVCLIYFSFSEEGMLADVQEPRQGACVHVHRQGGGLVSEVSVTCAVTI